MTGTYAQQVGCGITLPGCQLVECRAESSKQIGKALPLSGGGRVLKIQITTEVPWVW